MSTPYLEIQITQVTFFKTWWNTYRWEYGIEKDVRHINMTRSGRCLGKKRAIKQAKKSRDDFIANLDPRHNLVAVIPAPGKEPPPPAPVYADVGP